MGNECSNLQPQVLADLQDQTGMSQNEIRAYYRNYRKECHTSKMTIDEEALQRFYADVFPKGDAAGFASHVFKVLDRDGNGGIDFREFIMAVSITQTGTRDDRTKWLFELFDIDGTGFIKRAELVDMIETLRSLRTNTAREDEASTEEIADHLLSRAGDSDGKLCQKEFLTCVNESETMQKILSAAMAVAYRPIDRKQSFGQGRPRAASAPRKTSIRKVSTGSAPRSRSGTASAPRSRASTASAPRSRAGTESDTRSRSGSEKKSSEGSVKRQGSFEMKRLSDWVQRQFNDVVPRKGSFNTSDTIAESRHEIIYDEPPKRLVKGQKWLDTQADIIVQMSLESTKENGEITASDQNTPRKESIHTEDHHIKL